mmetsp:Transcript_20434/g.18049  ORF Transcript_20434/g.18049 Transcript_20434/m.18049 type:complete len:208 (+) Transcript_20434:157-780(+)
MASKPKISDELRECLKLLDELTRHDDAEAFLQPVDWEALKLPDYPVIIKKPMDLGTIRSNIENGEYDDAYDFAEDVRLVWKNAKLYNTPGSPIYVNAESLSQLFERKFPKIKKQFSAKSKYNKKSMDESSQEDRMKFTKLIKQISSDQLGQVVEIIDKKSPNALNDSEGEEDLEIEVYYIDNDTLQELIMFCEKCIKKTNKNKKNKK